MLAAANCADKMIRRRAGRCEGVIPEWNILECLRACGRFSVCLSGVRLGRSILRLRI